MVLRPRVLFLLMAALQCSASACSLDGGLSSLSTSLSEERKQYYLSEQQHIYDLAYSPDGKRILSSGLRSGIKVWDAETGTLEERIPGYFVTSGTLDPWLSEDREKFAELLRWGGFRIWGTSSGELVADVKSVKNVKPVGFAKDTDWFLRLSATNLELWHVPTDRIRYSHKLQTIRIPSVYWSPNRKWALLGYRWGNGFRYHEHRLLNVETGELTIPPVLLPPTPVLFSDDEKFLAVGEGTAIKVFDLSDWKLRLTCDLPAKAGGHGGMRPLHFSLSTQLLVAVSGHYAFVACDASSGKTLSVVRGQHYAAALSPDASLALIYVEGSYTVEMWDVRNGRYLGDLCPPGCYGRSPIVSAITFSPDGKSVAIAALGNIDIWSLVPTPQKIRTLVDPWLAIQKQTTGAEREENLCSIGDSYACFQRGERAQGQGDRTAAQEWFLRACFASGAACRAIAKTVDPRWEPFRWGYWLTQGCGMEDGESCLSLGVHYQVKQQYDLAAAAFLAGCRLGRACGHYWLLLKRTGAHKESLERARDLVCNIDAHECGVIGHHFEREGQMQQALAIYERSCAGGHRWACKHLISLVKEGKVETVDEELPNLCDKAVRTKIFQDIEIEDFPQVSIHKVKRIVALTSSNPLTKVGLEPGDIVGLVDKKLYTRSVDLQHGWAQSCNEDGKVRIGFFRFQDRKGVWLTNTSDYHQPLIGEAK